LRPGNNRSYFQKRFARASDRSARVSPGRRPAEQSAIQLNRQDCNRILPSVSTFGRSTCCCAMTCRFAAGDEKRPGTRSIGCGFLSRSLEFLSNLGIPLQDSPVFLNFYARHLENTLGRSGSSIMPGGNKTPRRRPHAPVGLPSKVPRIAFARRPVGLLGALIPEPAGARGSRRRSGTLVLPDRRLPYLRMRVDCRLGER
jgi:hypothetical protein